VATGQATGQRSAGTVATGQATGRRSLLRIALAVGLALLVTACAGDNLPQDMLAPEGPIARKQDGLWNLVFGVAVGVFVLVEAILVLVLVKFRARPDDTTVPKQTHGNTRLEVLWTVIPALVLAVIAVPTVQLIFELADTPEGALEVRVVGKQYWWEFEYTGDEGRGVVTANELVIPTGRPVALQLESTGQADSDPLGVIHSFWVPKLAGKQDVVPGHVRHLIIEAEEPGTYSGQCAEFCGLSHANMRLAVKAVSSDEFTTWIEEHSSPQPPPTSGDGARGAELFTERQCIGCHAIDGYEGAEARVGPNLTFFAQREKFAGYMLDNDINEGAENVSAWLKDPQAVKPGSQMPNLGLSDGDIADLVEYLRTLQ
jgi:cytochrome c oxidase subunit 2